MTVFSRPVGQWTESHCVIIISSPLTGLSCYCTDCWQLMNSRDKALFIYTDIHCITMYLYNVMICTNMNIFGIYIYVCVIDTQDCKGEREREGE